jgi:ribosomal protein L37AE/L43A
MKWWRKIMSTKKKIGPSRQMCEQYLFRQIKSARCILDSGCMSVEDMRDCGITMIGVVLGNLTFTENLMALVGSVDGVKDGELTTVEKTVFFRRGYATCPHCGKVTVPTEGTTDCTHCNSFAASTGYAGQQIALRHLQRILDRACEYRYYDLQEIPWTELPL